MNTGYGSINNTLFFFEGYFLFLFFAKVKTILYFTELKSNDKYENYNNKNKIK